MPTHHPCCAAWELSKHLRGQHSCAAKSRTYNYFSLSQSSSQWIIRLSPMYAAHLARGQGSVGYMGPLFANLPRKGREKGEVCVTLIIAAAKPLRIDMKSCSQLRVQGGGVFNGGLYGLQGPCVRRMMPHSLHVGHVRRSATGQTSSILKRLNRGGCDDASRNFL